MWPEKSLKFAKARFLGNCPIWVETWIFKTRLNLQVKPIRCNFRRNTITTTPRNASSKSFFEFYEILVITFMIHEKFPAVLYGPIRPNWSSVRFTTLIPCTYSRCDIDQLRGEDSHESITVVWVYYSSRSMTYRVYQLYRLQELKFGRKFQSLLHNLRKGSILDIFK